MPKLQSAVPQNLTNLWASEDEIANWAAVQIAEEEYLGEFLEFIETYMDCADRVRQSAQNSERHVAIVGLFLRTFDGLSHCLRSAMSGNYTGCAMYARDLLETCFLLDYLLEKPGRPEAWLGINSKTVPQEYKPITIRKYLDDRDGYTEKRRATHYQMLCALGAQPSPAGFELKRNGAKLIQSGPFKQRESLEQCIQETAKLTVLLAERLRQFCLSDFKDGKRISSTLSLKLQFISQKHSTK